MGKLLLGIAALAGGVYLFMGKAFAGPLGIPAQSEPDSLILRQKKPVKTQATAASGRKYEVWMYPPQPNIGVYTVARELGGKAWIAFVYHADSNKYIPVKTNVTEIGLPADQVALKISQLKTDWKMA